MQCWLVWCCREIEGEKGERVRDKWTESAHLKPAKGDVGDGGHVGELLTRWWYRIDEGDREG